MRVSLPQRLLDLIAPRSCCVCGTRLAPEESHICLACNLHLPRTDHPIHPYDNDLAKVFWGRVRHMERAAALMYHHGGSQASYPIYRLKYHHQPDIGLTLGRMMALELLPHGFFEGIDALVPVPLSAKRQAERGYNQSELLARGIAEETGLRVQPDVLARREYHGSQTTRGRWERNANVEHAFSLLHGDKIRNSHVLLVDDIVTTGATLCACAKLLEQVEGVKISVASVGFVDQRR
ncbi:MAG: ComF family protein [Prevotella sp.]|nr:ComF family protein [Prevotella sp.]